MPTYEYYCHNCRRTFEYFQKITAEPLVSCPECHQTVERKISGGSGLIFKGSGFYSTDYKKNGNGESVKEAGTPDITDKTKKSEKTESKDSTKTS